MYMISQSYTWSLLGLAVLLDVKAMVMRLLLDSYNNLLVDASRKHALHNATHIVAD